MTLTPIVSDDLPVRHGFFTRQGGASSGIFDSLNCGLGSTDQREMVLINRGRVAEHLGVETDHLCFVHQTHSADVVTLSGPLPEVKKADAMVTAEQDMALAILTADCQPVLFVDQAAGVIGAAHAGWRGALDGVLENTLDAMINIGASRTSIIAVIGPSISQRAYEVGPEFLDRFIEDDPDNARFFANGQGDRYMFDLIGFGLARLRAAGVQQAGWIGQCTYSDSQNYFSYRRSVHEKEADYGRLISAIRL